MYFQIIKYIIQCERSKETMIRSIRIDAYEREVDVLRQENNNLKKKKKKTKYTKKEILCYRLW